MKGLLGGLLLGLLIPGWCAAQPAGYVDDVSCTTTYGWAWNTGSPVTVAFYSDGVQFGTVVANYYRSDVQAVYGGSGSYGFNFNLPSGLKDGQTHTIAAVAGGQTLGSSGTSLSLSCTAQTPYYTYTESTTTNSAMAPSDLQTQTQNPNWTANGTIGSTQGGSYIWNNTPSSWNSEYEVRTSLTLYNSRMTR